MKNQKHLYENINTTGNQYPEKTKTPDQLDLDQILDLNTLVQKYPQFPLNRMRWIIQQRAVNNIEASGALFKASNRWFFDVPLFIQWLKTGGKHESK